MTDDELDALEVRVANGIVWLDQHDPGSRFHTWWQAGLTPASLLPAHEATPEVRAAWTEYYGRRQLWERLDKTLMATKEGHVRTGPQTVIEWRPAPARP